MKKILIIDDDQLVAKIYSNKFITEGYEISTAQDGESGFAALAKFRPDVVILDLMLPKISGIDLLKKIRAEDDFKNTPVIVFSNTYLSNLVQEAWKAGATKCLSKASATPKQIIEVVRTTVSKAGASQPQTGVESGREISGAETSAASTVTVADKEAEAAYQVDLQHSFSTLAPTTLSNCLQQLQLAVKSLDESAKIKALLELYRLIHTLTANAGIAGATGAAQLSEALEALLKELCDKPKNINASTLRTVALTLDFLGLLVKEIGDTGKKRTDVLLKPSILVVDDEAISRRALTYALEKAKLPSVGIDNPETALKMVAETRYDLVFLDVDMPGMNGFELCAKLRGTELNKNTPVVFVTGLNGFENRANSIMSGGDDLIAKPFLFMELAVKALVFVLKGRPAQGVMPVKNFKAVAVSA